MVNDRLRKLRPFVPNGYKIQFTVFTSNELARAANNVDVGRVARQSIVSVVGEERINSDVITGAGVTYDQMTNNLFVRVNIEDTSLSLDSIRYLVEDMFPTLSNVVGNEAGMRLETNELNSSVPEHDTFILIDQGGLDENIEIRPI